MATLDFIPSVYQSAVYGFITKDNGNAVIDAVAGSGKSTTIVNALKLIPKDKSVLFLAFNKAIVEELKVKIGNIANVEIKTLHSLGMSVITRTFKSYVDNNKYRTRINDGIKYGGIKPINKLEFEEQADYKANIVKLVDLCRAYLCSDLQTLYAIADKYLINILDNECEIALSVVDWGKDNVSVIDFTDMIYFPNVLKIKMPQYDYVLIDECQDLNTAQRELFLKVLKPNTGRFVAVGDPRQAIYGFAGSDIESFNTLKSLPNTQLLPLSVCYRSDSAIIELAKALVPQIECRDNAPEGLVDQNAQLVEIKDGDMVLCRVTAPLVALCMEYIASGVKAYVKGRDIGANLINMIAKTNRKLMVDVMVRLEAELDKLMNKVVSKSHCSYAEAREDAMYKSYADKVRAIEVISEGLTVADEVMNRIETIFKDDQKSGICLSTVHKAKGLESDNVYIICEDKFLLKRCMRIPWMAEQERNIVYVAYTRAKHKLGFVRDFIFE